MNMNLKLNIKSKPGDDSTYRELTDATKCCRIRNELL